MTKEGSASLNESRISKENNESSYLTSVFKDNDINFSMSVQINEAEYKMNPHNYSKYVEILQLLATFGSTHSASKLGYINLRGLNATLEPDYASSAAYYLIALKFIKMTPNTKWDTGLILEVVEGLTEVYRFHSNLQRDLLIWDHGIKMMKFVDSVLEDSLFLKDSDLREFRQIKAIRIHIAYCLALTAEAESKNTGDYRKTVDLYRECEQMGNCGLTAADKLVKKAHTKFRLLGSRVPRVQPICTTCNFKASDLKAIWGLLVCPKCQTVACCSRACLKKHLNLH